MKGDKLSCKWTLNGWFTKRMTSCFCSSNKERLHCTWGWSVMQGSLLTLDHILILPHLLLFIDTSETRPSDKLISIRTLEREEQLFSVFREARRPPSCTKRSAGLKKSQRQLYNENWPWLWKLPCKSSSKISSLPRLWYLYGMGQFNKLFHQLLNFHCKYFSRSQALQSHSFCGLKVLIIV